MVGMDNVSGIDRKLNYARCNEMNSDSELKGCFVCEKRRRNPYLNKTPRKKIWYWSGPVSKDVCSWYLQYRMDGIYGFFTVTVVAKGFRCCCCCLCPSKSGAKAKGRIPITRSRSSNSTTVFFMSP